MSINTAELTQHTTETKITQGKLAVVGTLSPEHQAIFPVEAQTFYSNSVSALRRELMNY